jgi:hypothetical protein
MRRAMLLDKLHSLRYHDAQHMTKYCKKFRHIEMQISDMAFDDRVDYFVRKLHFSEVTMHIRNQQLSEDIKVVYQLTRQWTINARLLKLYDNYSNHCSDKSLLKFDKNKFFDISTSTSTVSTAITKDSDKELDVIVFETLNKMNLMTTICFNCEKHEHYVRDYKSLLQKDKKISFFKRNYSNSNHDNKCILYQMVDDLSNDQSDYEILVLSSSDDDDGDDDVLNLMSTYEFNHDQTSVVVSNDVMFKKLSVYDIVFNDKKSEKKVVDNDASNLYLNEKKTEFMDLKVTSIKLCKVKVADKNTVMVNNYCSFEIKIKDLSKKTITTYIFFLGSIDLILGLS